MQRNANKFPDLCARAAISPLVSLVGGAEWNGPAYDPQTNLVLIGEVDWCATVTLQNGEHIQKVRLGKPWSGMATLNPYNTYGTSDSFGKWAGWVHDTAKGN